jgi:hypothetical protein
MLIYVNNYQIYWFVFVLAVVGKLPKFIPQLEISSLTRARSL